MSPPGVGLEEEGEVESDYKNVIGNLFRIGSCSIAGKVSLMDSCGNLAWWLRKFKDMRFWFHSYSE